MRDLGSGSLHWSSRPSPAATWFSAAADVAAAFIRHGLIDEFRPYVHPVVIGAGKPAFSSGTRIDLKLAETRTFGNGVVLLRYLTR